MKKELKMQISKEAILSQLQPDIAQKLLEFGHTITTHECDYYLFMSRKFCCLYDLLARRIFDFTEDI